ncbi:MAG TPA: ATP-binding protein, partial [Thermoanaerobaculia bacterium]|nr:ATP-binding protein [Thermoanaerobaculia bacterium]
VAVEEAPAAGAPAPLPVPGPAPAAEGLLPPRVVYLLAGLTFLATLAYIALLQTFPERYALQAYAQFGGDLLLITLLVYLVGGIASPFSLLYLIVIAVASTMLRRRAGILVASAAYLLYAPLVLGLYFGWIPAPPHAPAESVSALRLIYNLAVHLFGFYAVALLISYLAHDVARAERALEEKSEDLADLQIAYRDVIQSIGSGLVTTDLEGTVTSVNRAALEMLGGVPGAGDGELVGLPVHRTGLFAAARWRQIAAAGLDEAQIRAEVEVPRGGETATFGYTVAHLTDAAGARRGYIVVFQDLTRWRHLQEQVRLKDRMAAVGELAAGLAHEIGNPLAAISGSVQMLSGSLGKGDSERKLIEILLKESQRLDRTIKGFLRFARPRERASVHFDIAKLVANNFALLENSEEVSPRHRLALDLDPPSASLVADPDQVSQIFWNLARNALRAMPDGGELRISGRLEGGSYRLQVADTGRGMSEEQRANLFHPFQSFFDSGTGIGMAIVYRIVQEHGGRLDVESQPGRGTMITVDLPAAGAKAAAAALAAEARP